MALILGSRGMLGNMMAQVMPEASVLNRPVLDATKKIRRRTFKAYNTKVINCIGLIKPYCDDVKTAIKVNALFPYQLPYGSIQIATDCVYSGAKGNYVEADLHDALDVYGKTKSLGEGSHIHNLRCSIIGPEIKNHTSLLDWFLAQEGEVKGFTNHFWNGVTTYHFARIVKGILESGEKLPNLQHIVPADQVTKAELLQMMAEEFNKDIKVKEVKAPQAVNRTLSTNDPDFNKHLWQLAGYKEPPTIRQMIKELAAL